MATTDDKIYFVDTNILIAASDTTRSAHAESHELFERAMNGAPRLFVSGQILREYLVVATRPVENNGLGLNPKGAIENLQSFRYCLQLLQENDVTTRRLETLMANYQIKGRRIHDANIASVMIENGLKSLITLNPKGFNQFEEVETLYP